MRRGGHRMLLVLGLSATVVSCGSSAHPSPQADAARVRATITRAFHALATGDGAVVCALTTSSGRQTLAASLPHSSCANVVVLASHRLTSAQRAALASIEVKHVATNAGHAVVTDADLSSRRGSLRGFIDSHSAPTELTEQSDGSWKISG